MKRRTAAATGAAFLMAVGAASGALAAGTPLSAADSKYLTEDAQGSIYDLATGQAAVQKAQNARVFQYASRLVDDHNRLNKQMFLLARKRQLELPLTIADSDKVKLATLTVKQGAAFDKAYIDEAVKINADDVQSAQKELAATHDPEVRALVSTFLVTEKKHLAEAKQLQGMMGG